MIVESNDHLVAAVFGLALAIGTAYAWTSPDLRPKLRWGEYGIGVPMSEYSLGTWFAAFLVFAAVEFAWAFEVPLPRPVGIGLNVLSLVAIGIGSLVDSKRKADRGSK